MRKSPQGIDGFTPRRPTRSIGDVREATEHQIGKTSNATQIGEAKNPISAAASSTKSLPRPVSRSDINESLRQIDDQNEVSAKKKRRFRGKVKNKTQHPRRKFIKRIIILMLLAMVALGGFVGIKALIASANVFQGNIFGVFLSKPLKTDANGRSSILVLGSTDDDPNHAGNTLTDTIMVISLDQKKKTAAMFSIPRDLWVEYGEACSSGYQGKINSYFYCTEDGTSKDDEQKRLKNAQKFIGDIVGLDLQYGAHVNSIVVKDAVSAVGGIDVKIDSKDPRGIMDRNFDGQCNYRCYNVKYTNGTHRLDGNAAMYLSMARGANGGYGLGSNFEREQNQQNVMMALQKKATSSGVLSNPAAVTRLIDSVGNNLRTNFDSGEVQTLIGLAKDIPSSKIQRIQLNDEKKPLVTTGFVGSASVVRPVEGLFEYTNLRRFIKQQINADPVAREAASVVVYNGSGINGFGGEKSDKLTELGFTISDTLTAPVGTYDKVELYVLNDSKPATKSKLESIYKIKAKTTEPPVSVGELTDIVIIYGKQPSQSEQ